MALTINRRGELSDQDLDKLKDKFNKKTCTGALYATSQYVLNDVPKMEEELTSVKKKFNNLLKIHKALVRSMKEDSISELEQTKEIINKQNN